MEKLVIIFLTAILAVSMTACGGTNTSEEAGNSSISQASTESAVSDNNESIADESSKGTADVLTSDDAETSESSDNETETTEDSVSETTEISSDTSESTQSSVGQASKSTSNSSGSSTSGSSSSSSSGSSGSPGSSSGSNEIGPLLSKYYLDIVNSGKFYMDAQIDGTANGQTLKNTPLVMAVDQANNKAYLSTESSGMSIIILSDGKDTYMLYPLTKTAIKFSADSSSSMTDISIIESAAGDTLLVGTGSETFNGKKCQYETYYGNGVTVTYYFYNNALYGIVAQSDETDKSSSDYINVVMIINTLTTEVDDSLFTVPSDYKVTESSGLNYGLTLDNSVQ